MERTKVQGLVYYAVAIAAILLPVGCRESEAGTENPQAVQTTEPKTTGGRTTVSETPTSMGTARHPSVPLEGLSAMGKQVYRLFRDGKNEAGWAILRQMPQTADNLAEMAALRAYARMNYTGGYLLVSTWHLAFFAYDNGQAPEDVIEEDLAVAGDLREDFRPMIAHMIMESVLRQLKDAALTDTSLILTDEALLVGMAGGETAYPEPEDSFGDDAWPPLVSGNVYGRRISYLDLFPELRESGAQAANVFTSPLVGLMGHYVTLSMQSEDLFRSGYWPTLVNRAREIHAPSVALWLPFLTKIREAFVQRDMYASSLFLDSWRSNWSGTESVEADVLAWLHHCASLVKSKVQARNLAVALGYVGQVYPKCVRSDDPVQQQRLGKIVGTIQTHLGAQANRVMRHIGRSDMMVQ